MCRKRNNYKIHFGIFDTLRNHGNKDCKHNDDLMNIIILGSFDVEEKTLDVQDWEKLPG